MNPAPYTAEQEDALQEVANIAMGQAASSLAALLDAYVALSVPQSRIVDAAEVSAEVARMTGREEDLTAVRQAFYGAISGEAILLFEPCGCDGLADLLGYDCEAEPARDELLLDVSNILVGAVLNGMSGQLGQDFGFNPPAILGRGLAADELLENQALSWRHALLIEVNFSLESRGFKGHLVLLMPAGAIDLMREVLERMLAEL